MKKFFPVFAFVALSVGSLPALQHSFTSNKVTFNQLPPVAQAAVKKEAGNNPINDVDMETFDGFTTYQASFNKGGKHHEYRVDAHGNPVGGHWREIPAAVEKAADKKIGNAKLLGFRKQAVNGEPLYHFRYDNNGTPANLWLTAAGTPAKAPVGQNIIETAGANTVTAGQSIPAPSTPQANAAGGTWVQFKDLPWPVQQSIMQQAGGASVTRVYKTEKDGQAVYHARFDKNGQPTRIAVKQDGTVQNTVTGAAANAGWGAGAGENTNASVTTPLANGSKVSFNDLPQPVKTAITTQANGATVEDIDKGTVAGQTVYEAAFKKDGKTYELQVKEDGTVLGGHFD
jgi:uncharacterized membrane protein YkoI